jgi:hypothetical protein
MNRLRPYALAAALLAALPALAEKGALVEKSVDVPRERQVTVDIPYEKAALTTVESVNDPTERDMRDARETDPNDATLVLLRFHYKNDDYFKHKVKLRAVLLDAKDGVLAEGGRTATLDAQQTDDTITFPLKVKTLDWPGAAKLKVIATFLN